MNQPIESPIQAAQRLGEKPMRDGFKFLALHKYKDLDGNVTYWRIRLKHPNFDSLSPEKKSYYKNAKWIRPMHFNGESYAIGEPKFSNKEKPLYGLHELTSRPDDVVFFVEGENKVDALSKLGILAVTSGSATTADNVDLAPLKGRNIKLWHDNDETGLQYAKSITKELRSLGCNVQMIDVAALKLPPKGDAVDWLELHPGATADDVLQLTTLDAAYDEADDAYESYDADDTEIASKEIIAKAEELALLPDVLCHLKARQYAKEMDIGIRVLQKEIKNARQRHRIAEAKKESENNGVVNGIHALDELEVQWDNLPAVARAVAEILANDPNLFFRGKSAQMIYDSQAGSRTIRLMTKETVINSTHDHVRPYQWVNTGNSREKEFITLPEPVARLYLDIGNSGLRPLDGITSSPLLSDDGSMRAVEGYDAATHLYCENVPQIKTLNAPTREQAKESLMLLRRHFCTFAFADAIKVSDDELGVDVVDISKPPGKDESAALVGLLTAVCRASLHLAPGLKVSAAAYSGAGTGKGLLVRVICAIAMGTQPRAISSGGNLEELDKRITAELIGANPALFLDNLNGTTLRSDVLASVLTERPASARKLGKSEILLLNSAAFVAVTGNGLLLSEDMMRRFITVEMDAGENPETRPFKGNLIAQTLLHRAELLAAVLTIWRWGRQNQLKSGKTLGSFEQWGEWCRDPLLALGCADPVERVLASKMDDPERRYIGEVFNAWWQHHQNNSVTAAGLNILVKDIIDPQSKGRQYLAVQVRKLEGTRMTGYVLTRENAGKWGADKYQLQQLNSQAQQTDDEKHRVHRGHSEGQVPMNPMVPMPPEDHHRDPDNFNSFDEEQAIQSMESVV